MEARGFGLFALSSHFSNPSGLERSEHRDIPGQRLRLVYSATSEDCDQPELDRLICEMGNIPARPASESPAEGESSRTPRLAHKASSFFKRFVSSPAAIFRKSAEPEASTSNQEVPPFTLELPPRPPNDIRKDGNRFASVRGMFSRRAQRAASLPAPAPGVQLSSSCAEESRSSRPTILQRLRRLTRRGSRPQEEDEDQKPEPDSLPFLFERPRIGRQSDLRNQLERSGPVGEDSLLCVEANQNVPAGLLTSLDPLPDEQRIDMPVDRPDGGILGQGGRFRLGTREYAGQASGRRTTPALALRPSINDLLSIGGYDRRLRTPALIVHNKRYRAGPLYYKPWEVSQWVKLTSDLLGPWSAEIGSWKCPKSSYKDTVRKEYPIKTSQTLPDLRSTWISSQPNDVTLSYCRPPNSVNLVKFDCYVKALSFEPEPNNPVPITNKHQLGGIEFGSDSASYQSRIRKSRDIDFIFEPIPVQLSGTTRRVAKLSSEFEEDSQELAKLKSRSERFLGVNQTATMNISSADDQYDLYEASDMESDDERMSTDDCDQEVALPSDNHITDAPMTNDGQDNLSDALTEESEEEEELLSRIDMDNAFVKEEDTEADIEESSRDNNLPCRQDNSATESAESDSIKDDEISFQLPELNLAGLDDIDIASEVEKAATRTQLAENENGTNLTTTSQQSHQSVVPASSNHVDDDDASEDHMTSSIRDDISLQPEDDIVRRLNALDVLFESSSEYSAEYDPLPELGQDFRTRNARNQQSGLIPLLLVPMSVQIFVSRHSLGPRHNNYLPSGGQSVNVNEVVTPQTSSSPSQVLNSQSPVTIAGNYSTMHPGQFPNAEEMFQLREAAAAGRIAFAALHSGPQSGRMTISSRMFGPDELLPLLLVSTLRRQSHEIQAQRRTVARLVRRTSMIRLREQHLSHWNFNDERHQRQDPFGRRPLGPEPDWSQITFQRRTQLEAEQAQISASSPARASSPTSEMQVEAQSLSPAHAATEVSPSPTLLADESENHITEIESEWLANPFLSGSLSSNPEPPQSAPQDGLASSTLPLPNDGTNSLPNTIIQFSFPSTFSSSHNFTETRPSSASVPEDNESVYLEPLDIDSDDAAEEVSLRGGGKKERGRGKGLLAKASARFGRLLSKTKAKLNRAGFGQKSQVHVPDLANQVGELACNSTQEVVSTTPLRRLVFNDARETPGSTKIEHRIHKPSRANAPDAIMLSNGGILPTSTDGYAVVRKRSAIPIPWVNSTHGDIRRMVAVNLNKPLPKLPEVDEPTFGGLPNSRSWVAKAFKKAEDLEMRRRRDRAAGIMTLAASIAAAAAAADS